MENKMKKLEEQDVAEVLERNIAALIKRRKTENEQKSRQEKVADGITKFAGSLMFVYIHLCIYGVWVIWNLGWLGLKPFDESFVVLAMAASVEAIFISTFVLISQNRAAEQADKRADLDLQISLLAEHEITRVLSLVTLLAKKMDIKEADQPDIEELSRDVEPEQVLDTIEKHSKKKDR